MTRRTRWPQAEQKCCTPRCCLWPRKAKWWFGCEIPSIHKGAGRGLGLQARYPARCDGYRWEARHELTNSRGEEWRNGAGRAKAGEEREEEVASRSSRRDRHRGAASGEAAVRTSLVRADRGCGVGTFFGKDLCRGGSLALGDAHSPRGAQPGGPRG